nr:MAG: RNA dependent RNA polymerase [Hameenlinna toti-like virus]
MTLREYIKKGKWITGGSSTIGHVEWEYDEKQGKFKARKNMVPLLFTPDELYDCVMAWDGVTISKAFIKSEVAKRRLAVASNFEAYIMDSYLMYLFGHGWKDWKYITLDETPQESQRRTAEVSRLLKKGCYALPFDYDKFDHQATTPELMVIVNKMINAVQVPCWYGETWTRIKQTIQSGYQHGVMRILLPNGETAETRVTGGLPSGVRLTSLIGNVWNAVVTNVVIKMAEELTQRAPAAVAVRGDDTYVLSESPAYLGLVRRLYQAVNARGKDTKFGISRGICEFLRNEISAEGSRGWPNRSITSCTQRRPWSSAAWGIDQQVTVTRAVIDSLSRRVRKDVSFLHRANQTKWSRFYRQSSNWLCLPRRLGGIGIYEDRGLRPSGKLPLTAIDRVHYQNVIPTSPPWADMTREQQLEFSRLEMTCRQSTDDVPKASLARKNELIDAVRKTKIKWHKEQPIKERPVVARCPRPTEPMQWPTRHRAVREVVTCSDGTEVSFEEALATASNVARAKKVSVRQLLQPLYPGTWTQIMDWERRGWHRTDAINIVLGKTPTELCFPLHPELSVFVQEQIARRYKAWYGRESIASKVYGYTRGSVRSIIDQGGSYVYSY